MRTLLVLFAIVLPLLAWSVIPQEQDNKIYAALVELAQGRPGSIAAKQVRKGILKEGWVGRHYVSLEGRESELYLIAAERDAIEEIDQVTATLYTLDESNKSFESRQTFWSQKARAYYKSRHIAAGGVHFIKYGGNDSLGEVTGTSERLEMVVKRGGIDLVAYGVVADFDTQLPSL